MKDNLLKYSITILLGIFFSLIIFRADFLEITELFFYNLRLELQNKNPQIDEINLVLLDKKTLEKYNNYFVPYSEYSKLIEIIKSAKVIGIDKPFIQFTSLDDVKTLAKTLEKNKNVVLSSQFIGRKQNSKQNTVTYVVPLPTFTQYSKYGYNNYDSDIDGIVRKGSFYFFSKNKFLNNIESFAFVISKMYGKKISYKINNYYINYFCHHNCFKTYSFIEILENPDEFKDIFTGKIVLIGDGYDSIVTPDLFSHEMYQVEVHANNIATILKDQYIKKSNILINSIFLLIMILVGIYLSLFFSKEKGLLLVLLSGFIYTIFNFIVFIKFNLWINLFPSLLGLILSFFIIKYSLYSSKNKEITKIKNIFKPYLTPEMIDEVIKEKNYIDVLKSERRIVTVIFADIADFTVLSEKLPTDEVVRILNECLTKMTNVILNNNGTLDKYTGDGVMAVFGNIGKVETKVSVYNAIKTAIEMKKELEGLQKKWLNSGLKPLQIRIGINTGEAVVGSVGSPQHMDITVIGDTVNTASRLEQLNKKLNTTMIITVATYEFVKEFIKVKALGEVTLKGKHEKVEIYELIDWNDNY